MAVFGEVFGALSWHGRQSGRMGSFVYGSRGGDWSAKNSYVKPCVVEFRAIPASPRPDVGQVRSCL